MGMFVSGRCGICGAVRASGAILGKAALGCQLWITTILRRIGTA
jgi:hypothetical protein